MFGRRTMLVLVALAAILSCGLVNAADVVKGNIVKQADGFILDTKGLDLVLPGEKGPLGVNADEFKIEYRVGGVKKDVEGNCLTRNADGTYKINVPADTTEILIWVSSTSGCNKLEAKWYQ